MSRWFRSAAKSHASPMFAEDEDRCLQQVEHALLQLLNDDIAEADRVLKDQDSAYHHLGRGISSFIASMLGVEKELLKDAASTLQLAENKAWENLKKSEQQLTAFRSNIYPPGTEYLLCSSVAQLTSAICAVLSGSVTEAIKGFYNLRKAYVTLDGIMNVEARYLRSRTGSRKSSLVTRKESSIVLAQNFPASSHEGANRLDLVIEKSNSGATDTAGKFMRTKSKTSGVDLLDDLSVHPATRVESRLLDIDPASVGITSHTDIFIHSGTRLCYGLLLVIFSMIESPYFTKILYIVGFKGDRERGTRYLWQSARFNNFNSAIAGMALLSYYNGLVGSCDILPTDAGADDDLSGYPKARCRALLSDMRKQYPDSKLWRLEEARMHSFNRNLEGAVKILADNSDSNMKQIETIVVFEMALTTMFLHDYELCAKSWVQCAELSKWSPTLYAYLTGVAYLEMYRNHRNGDPSVAKTYKDKATEYIRRGPPLAGRQKLMSQQLPFDMYIVRKVQKWDARATAWGVDLVDAIGVSPLTEMIYFWGGAKKQDPEQLQRSLDLLDWSRTSAPEKFRADLDETAIQAVLRACMFRNLARHDDSRELLRSEVLNHERREFKGPLKDDWTLPCAHYEMAVIAWNEKDGEGADHNARVADCEHWLEKTHKWPDTYILDARMSVKITTSLMTLKRHKKIIGI